MLPMMGSGGIDHPRVLGHALHGPGEPLDLRGHQGGAVFVLPNLGSRVQGDKSSSHRLSNLTKKGSTINASWVEMIFGSQTFASI
jgi:hypothetical protein